MKNIDIKTYIYFNNNHEVLCFSDEDERGIYIPRLFGWYCEEEVLGENIVKLLGQDECSLVYEENNILKDLSVTYKYYACNKELNKKEIKQINNFCNNYKLVPHYLSFEELSCAKSRNYEVDSSIGKVLKKVDDKITYREY